MFFVLQDVAMPDVFIAAGPRTDGHYERCGREIELHQHGRAFAWVHPHRLFPTELIRLRSSGRPLEIGKWAVAAHLEWLAGEHLNINKVEMDGVRIGRQIKDAPD